MSREVGEFFDTHAAGYHGHPAGLKPLHLVTAAKIEEAVDGRTLGLGGLWTHASLFACSATVVVADLSFAMLRTWAADGAPAAQCDALELPFAAGSLDHVVLPLILHHVAGSSARQSEVAVRQVLEGVRSILKPGGTVWISELCPAPTVYRIEKLMAFVTRFLLGLVGEPLVMMHSEQFYVDELGRQGWVDVRAERIESEDTRHTDLIRPVIAVPWLRIPRFLFPLRPVLIRARRPRSTRIPSSPLPVMPRSHG